MPASHWQNEALRTSCSRQTSPADPPSCPMLSRQGRLPVYYVLSGSRRRARVLLCSSVVLWVMGAFISVAVCWRRLASILAYILGRKDTSYPLQHTPSRAIRSIGGAAIVCYLTVISCFLRRQFPTNLSSLPDSLAFSPSPLVSLCTFPYPIFNTDHRRARTRRLLTLPVNSVGPISRCPSPLRTLACHQTRRTRTEDRL